MEEVVKGNNNKVNKRRRLPVGASTADPDGNLRHLVNIFANKGLTPLPRLCLLLEGHRPYDGGAGHPHSHRVPTIPRMPLRVGTAVAAAKERTPCARGASLLTFLLVPQRVHHLRPHLRREQVRLPHTLARHKIKIKIRRQMHLHRRV